MRKLIAWIVLTAVTLSLAFAIPASAKGYTMYVNKDVVEAHKKADPNSKVVKKLKGGTAVLLSGDILLGSKFTSILLEDTKHGGQMEAWVLTKYLSETMPPKYCKHQWGKWKVVKEATCTHEGKRTHTCKICGLEKSETIKKLAHEFGKWKVTKEATCTTEGTRVRTCKVCGYEEKEKYLAEHEYGSWKTTKEPSCTETGERERTCKVCGYTQVQKLDKLPHDYEWRVILEATDHSSGTRAKICKVCGHNGGEESFDPEGTLRRGDRGDDVRKDQQLLVDQGYLNAGGADGAFGGGTEKAVMQFQKDQGLEPDGVLWPQTIKRLQHDFGPWQTVKEMTRTEAGERVRVCKDCGYEQRETVEPGPVFERGRRGEDIRALQQIVKQLGYDAGGFDGIYGRKLDAAFAAFAADNDLVVEEGRIRPADVDAVMNAWLDSLPAGDWMGEGNAESPVNLALSVTSTGEADDSGLVTYNWSLTNLGSENGTYTALLLTFGETPDFKSEDLVMAIDGFDLKANAKNSVSGSFTADMDWGEGNLNFAALAISDNTGKKWLSNTVVFENENVSKAKTVEPMPCDIDLNNLSDGIWPVSFEPGDVYSGASGIYMNAVHIYTEDWYDIVDIDTLAVGDSIVVDGETIVVKSIKRDNGVIINGGLDEGGVELSTEEDSNGFCVRGYDDMMTYTDHGATTLVVDASATYTDGSDIEIDPVTYSGADIVDAIRNAEDNPYFDEFNTTVRTENGKVVEITRHYVP